MSQRAVEQVIGKMVLDKAFRSAVAEDSEKALAGYDLTAGEREGLAKMDHDDFHQTVSGLDQRVSKGLAWN